jgi:hypothetical protein
MSDLGHKLSATAHVRFTLNSDRESDFSQKPMSALTLKADVCSALANVCFGPIADIGAHSIWSARASSDGGTLRPSALAA